MREKLIELMDKLIERLEKILTDERLKAFFADKRKRRAVIISCSVIAVLIATASFAVSYVNDYYHADETAIEVFTTPYDEVSIENFDKGMIVSPEKPTAGFIFYPGGKVEYTSYLPLMVACAEKGILCVLIEMPYNLAVLDVDAASGIIDKFPKIDSWYIGGHSLGGSMAASYLADNPDEMDGLILLASYSTADVSASRVLSVYGSSDGVMNREKYEKYKTNLPASFTEKVIEGGNHALFGMYGAQKGDHEATITKEMQTQITAEYIAEFIKNRK